MYSSRTIHPEVCIETIIVLVLCIFVNILKYFINFLNYQENLSVSISCSDFNGFSFSNLLKYFSALLVLNFTSFHLYFVDHDIWFYH